MTWIDFPYYAFGIITCWVIGMVILIYSYKKKSLTKLALGMFIIGTLIQAVFILNLWQTLERPPLRTLGETRLWYSFFTPLIGYFVYIKWRYKWLLLYSFSVGILFLIINYVSPETYNKSLMPALVSPWFVPHVLVYLFAYAILSASFFVALKAFFDLKKRDDTKNTENLHLADNLVYLGIGFLTLGLLFGALWAKEAWGHYWAWDPKEIWAFLTWMGYLLYIHQRIYQPKKTKQALIFLTFGFIILMICWFGVNYLPVAQTSVHTYTQQP
ncbi:MAG: cytochrome c biogenesis protein [Flavobacteriales bacterium]